jgi:hypothetical protein
VHDVLADADTRTSLLENGVTAGHDRFFYIASPDGNFRLNFLGMVQTRFVFNAQDDSAPDDSTRWGFENSRTRFGVLGHVGDPSMKFGVWGGWLASGRSWLVEAWIRKVFDNGWSLDFGHFKVPVWKEWIIKEFHQQFVDRSVLYARWAGAGKGIRALYTDERLKLHATVTDGLWTWNNTWSTGPDRAVRPMPFQLSSEYALTARAEYLLGGSWASYHDFESFPDGEPLYAIAASAHYQVGEYGTPDDENEILQWQADFTAEFGGANLHAAALFTHFENSTTKRDEWGFMLQGGYFLTEDWELIARYEYGDLDGAGTVSDELSILTVGATRFWNRHGLKWMTDVGYGFKPVDEQWGAESLGWRPDGPGGDGQIVFRTQLQLMF